jgi:hypothetical protein
MKSSFVNCRPAINARQTTPSADPLTQIPTPFRVALGGSSYGNKCRSF